MIVRMMMMGVALAMMVIMVMVIVMTAEVVETGTATVAAAEIAEAAEVSKGTLFAYFPSKEEIVFADTSPLREQLCYELRHRSNGLSAVDTLRAFVADHMITPGPREALVAFTIDGPGIARGGNHVVGGGEVTR